MSDTKIPTSEDFLIQQLKDAGFTEDYIKMMFRLNKDSTSSYIECLQNFAKLHVQAALKAASEKAQIAGRWGSDKEWKSDEINTTDADGDWILLRPFKDSILTAYPLDNIK